MVAQGYYTDRAFGLTLTFITLTISSFQLYVVYHKRKQNPNSKRNNNEIKHYLHVAVLMCGITIMINFIDIFGVFGLIPFFAQNFVLNAFGTRFIMIGICLIIYGHFAAHYKALKKEIPTFFAYYFVITMALNFLGGITATILLEYANQYAYVGSILSVLWLCALLFIDLYGYYLVRTLVMELIVCQETMPAKKLHPQAPSMGEIGDLTESQPLSSSTSTCPVPTASTPFRKLSPHHHQQSSLPHQQQQPQAQQKTPSANPREFLARIRRFHMIFIFLVAFYITYSLYGVLNSASRNAGFMVPKPEQFSIGAPSTFMPYTYLGLCAFLTWWAWIPVSWEEVWNGMWSGHSKLSNIDESGRKQVGQGSKSNVHDESPSLPKIKLQRATSAESSQLVLPIPVAMQTPSPTLNLRESPSLVGTNGGGEMELGKIEVSSHDGTSNDDPSLYNQSNQSTGTFEAPTTGGGLSERSGGEVVVLVRNDAHPKGVIMVKINEEGQICPE